jgi:hypothetical protein
MENNEAYYKQYELNKKLINFDNIPLEFYNEFMCSIKNKR